MAHDSDPFARWEAAQQMSGRAILAQVARRAEDKPMELDPVLVEAPKQPADAGLVHFDADKVRFRLVARHPAQGIAVAEADLDHEWRRPVERVIEITVLDPVDREQFLERALLRRGQSARSANEAPDAPAALRLVRPASLGRIGLAVTHGPISPSIGDDADAKRFLGIRPAR